MTAACDPCALMFLLPIAIVGSIFFLCFDTARRPACSCGGTARTLYQRVANVCSGCGGNLPWDEP